MSFLDKLTFRQADRKTCRAWFGHDLGDVKLIFVERGPAKATVKIARPGDDGIYEQVANYELNQEGRKALQDCRDIAEDLL
jgi:hypothetical protein